VRRRRRKMYCGHARLCVCLSAAVRPHYCTDPDVTWGHGRGCPLVVQYWADLQSGHGLRCYANITRTLVPSLRPSRDDDIVRTAGWAGSARVVAGAGWRHSSPAGDRRATGGAPKTARRIQQAGAAGPPATGRRRGTFSTLLRQSGMRAFHWWRSGNKKRTQNVSEYMPVLALCLVEIVDNQSIIGFIKDANFYYQL